MLNYTPKNGKMEKAKIIVGALLGAGIAALLVLLVISPLITIAALNVLFGLSIPITFGTYFSTLWLTLMITASKRNTTAQK